MRIDIFDIKTFKCFFDVIADNCLNAVLTFNNSSLDVNVLSKNHVCFYSVKFDSAFFDEYSIDDGAEIVIDCNEFYKILKSARKGESLVLEIYDDKNTIEYIFESDKNRRVISSVLSDIEYSSAVPPEVETVTNVLVEISDLKPVLNDINKLVGVERLLFKVQGDNFIVTVPEDSLVGYTNKIRSALIASWSEDCQAYYTLPYLNELLKYKDINPAINFSFGDDKPLKYEITSPDNLVTCSGLIAPRIEEH